MKILKYLGMASMVLLAIFFVIGLAVPTFEYHTTVMVDESAEKCWQTLTDSSRMKSWIRGLKSIRLIGGSHNQPGGRYELVIVQDGTYVMTQAITKRLEPKIISFILENDVMKLEYSFTLAENSGSTNINGYYKATGNSLPWRSLLYLSKSYLTQSSQEQLDLLKAEVKK
jgi:hypothetical protein